jgi:hypothetical protein
MPNPGTARAARHPEGRRRADEFIRREDRPGWGVFECVSEFHDDAGLNELVAVLRANGWK